MFSATNAQTGKQWYVLKLTQRFQLRNIVKYGTLNNREDGHKG